MPQDNRYFIKSILDAMPDPVCYKDKNGIYSGINRIFAMQIVGLPEEEIVGYTLPEVAKKVIWRYPESAFVNETFLLKNVVNWNKDDTELLKRGGKSTQRYEGICTDGIKRNFLVNKSTLNNEKGEIDGILTVLQDITELNEAEKKIEKNEERYRIVIKQSGQLVYDYDVKNGKISWSGATREFLGYELTDFASTDIEVWLNRVHPEERNRIWQNFRKRLEKGENFQLEYRFRRMNESYIHVEENVVCLKDENDSVNRVLGVMKNVTENKLSQERLEISEENYRSFIQNFKGIAFQLDENFFPEFMHGEVEKITGYSEEEFLSRRVSWIDIIHPEDMPSIFKDIEKIKRSSYNSPRELDIRIIHKKNGIKWIRQSYQKIQGKNKRPDRYQGTAYDITEKKEAEKKIANIETARKKEIYHRLKNNLQVISSLLDLQTEKFSNKRCIDGSEVVEAFKESQNRIVSIALIHKELHEGSGEGALNFSSYLEKLVENLFQTYRLGNTNISLNLDLEEGIFFDIDIAVPLGMIVNELVSNSLKYAFPGKDSGEIQIKLFSKEAGDEPSDIEQLTTKGRFTKEQLTKEQFTEEQYTGGQFTNNKKLSKKEQITKRSVRYTLVVSDNGIGIPEKIDIKNPDTLGLQLVTILVDQLNGEIEVKKDQRTQFTISFSNIENISQSLHL